jgi:Rieske Fe-S protein
MVLRLPVVQPSPGRRRALLLGAAAGVAACGPTPNLGVIDEALPRPMDAGAGDVPDPGTDVADPGTDVGGAPHDVGTPPRDTGAGGVHDTGPIMRDTGPAAPPDTGPSCTPRGTMVGTVDSLPEGTFRVMGRGSSTVIIGRDAGGFYAFSGVCPHQGCAVGAPVGGAITCPCHGARFDANGAVTRGPARSSLPHREVTTCVGVVYLGTATVDPSTRTPA